MKNVKWHTHYCCKSHSRGINNVCARVPGVLCINIILPKVRFFCFPRRPREDPILERIRILSNHYSRDPLYAVQPCNILTYRIKNQKGGILF